MFLCRSGNRSIGAAEAATDAGIAPSYNVLDGFEETSTSSGTAAGPAGRPSAYPGDNHD